MNTTWLNRLPSFAVVAAGGMLFLTGCNDCDDCGKRVSDCAERGPVRVDAPPMIREERRVEMQTPGTFEQRPNFTSSERRDYGPHFQADERGLETSVRSDRSADFDIVHRQERLTEIERERVLYPEKAQLLDDEARRIRVEINTFNTNSGGDRRDFDSSRRFDSNNRDQNINVREREFRKDDWRNRRDATQPDMRSDRKEMNRDTSVKTDATSSSRNTSVTQPEPMKKGDAAAPLNSSTNTEIKSNTTTPVDSKNNTNLNTAPKSGVNLDAKSAENANAARTDTKTESKPSAGPSNTGLPSADVQYRPKPTEATTGSTDIYSPSDIKYENESEPSTSPAPKDVKVEGADKPAADSLNKVETKTESKKTE